MAAAQRAGYAQTVTGLVKGDDLGVTLPHEHLIIDSTCYYKEPLDPDEKHLGREKVALGNLAWMRRNYISNIDNLLLQDPVVAAEEAALFKKRGGGTIIDVGCVGLGRNPKALRQISEATGLHVIMGAGYYVEPSHPKDMGSKTVESIAAEIVNDIEVGVDGTGIRAGVIGEVGASWPLTPNERKSLQASAIAQRKTGAAITIHTARDDRSPLEIAEVLIEAGADMTRVAFGHMDRSDPNMDVFLQIAKLGSYLEFDLFGRETWVYPHANMNMITDGQRVDTVRALIDKGLIKQILISHDVSFKNRLDRFGGCGYHHIMVSVLPDMRRKGITEDQIKQIMVRNPRALFTFQ